MLKFSVISKIAKQNSIKTLLFVICFGSASLILAQNNAQCITPLNVAVNGKSMDLSKVGYFHNVLLTYAKDNGKKLNAPVTQCDRVDRVKTLTNSGIAASGEEIKNYINLSILTCSKYESDYPKVFNSDNSLNVENAKTVLLETISKALDLGAINKEEQNLLEAFVQKFVTGAPQNYCDLKNKWNAIPNKPLGGAYSASLLVLGAYSSDWWNVLPGGSESERLVGGPLVDLVHGAASMYWYMYEHWEDHYLDDFGKNFLKAFGNGAVEGSTFGIVRHLWP